MNCEWGSIFRISAMLQTMVAHLRERIMAITDKKKDQEQAAMIVEDMNIG